MSIKISYAQDNSDCFSKFQLLKMQNTSIDDVRMFLNGEGWSFDGAKSNQSFEYFKDPLIYDRVQWQKSTYSNGGKLILYNYINKPNIIIFHTNSNCFQQLFNSFTSVSKGITMIEDDILTISFKDNGIITEFRENKKDHLSTEYTILVYNAALKKNTNNVLKRNPDNRKDFANVFWKKEYTLFDLITDEPIFPTYKNGKLIYQIYYSSNEDPNPYYSEFTPDQLENHIYYKFKNKESCLQFCNKKK